MMLRYIGILLLLLSACKVQEVTELKPLEDVKKMDDLHIGIIEQFYTDVLDTLMERGYVSNRPISEVRAPSSCWPSNIERFDSIRLDLGDLSDLNQDSIDYQLSRFQKFRWSKVVPRKHVWTRARDYWYFPLGATYFGWKRLRRTGGKGCICRYSIPLFSSDYKTAVVERRVSCAPLLGFGEVLVFEFIDNEWVLLCRNSTWIS